MQKRPSFQARLGYFAGAFFYNALSVTENLFTGLCQLDHRFDQWWDEEVKPGDLRQRFDQWMPEYNELIGWTLEEVLADPSQIEEDDATALYRAFEELGDALLERWIRALGEIGIEAYALYPSAGHIMCVYYIFCGWLWRTLTEIERLSQDPRLQGTRVQQHYGEHAATVQRLIMLLRREEEVLTRHRQSPTADPEGLPTVLEGRLRSLAEEWPAAVYAAAREFRAKS